MRISRLAQRERQDPAAAGRAAAARRRRRRGRTRPRSTSVASSTASSTGPAGGGGHGPDRRDEAIASARQRLDEARVVGRVAERLAQLLDRRVEGVVEVDEGVGRPEPFAHRLAGDDLARAFQEHRQQLKRLVLQLQSDAVPAKLTAPRDRPRRSRTAHETRRASVRPSVTGSLQMRARHVKAVHPRQQPVPAQSISCSPPLHFADHRQCIEPSGERLHIGRQKFKGREARRRPHDVQSAYPLRSYRRLFAARWPCFCRRAASAQPAAAAERISDHARGGEPEDAGDHDRAAAGHPRDEQRAGLRRPLREGVRHRPHPGHDQHLREGGRADYPAATRIARRR